MNDLDLLILRCGILYLGAILVLIWACIPPKMPRITRKGSVTIIPQRYDDPWGYNISKRDLK